MTEIDKNRQIQNFVRTVRSTMDTKGLSLRQVALKAQISPSFFSRILSGKRGLPSDDVLINIAHAIDVEPDKLLVDCGIIPETLAPALRNPQVPELLRAWGELKEEDRKNLMKSVQRALLKHHRAKGTS